MLFSLIPELIHMQISIPYNDDWRHLWKRINTDKLSKSDADTINIRYNCLAVIAVGQVTTCTLYPQVSSSVSLPWGSFPKYAGGSALMAKLRYCSEYAYYKGHNFYLCNFCEEGLSLFALFRCGLLSLSLLLLLSQSWVWSHYELIDSGNL